VRLYVMGEEATEREATPEEIAQMRALVREALDAGAIGFATSKAPTHVGWAGRPVPSRAASFEEVLELAGALREVDHGMLQATVGRDLFLPQLADLQRAIGKTVSWTALLQGLFGPDGHRRALEMNQKLQEQGIDVVPQVSCRPLVVEFQFSAPFPFESMSLFKPVSEADREGRKRIYADPSFRAKFRERSGEGVLTGDWNDMVITECHGEPEVGEGKVSEGGAERGGHPGVVVLEVGVASGRARASCPGTGTNW
jgi:N-acyl-D-aspartate/D-glutamate deacylase